MLLVGGDLPGSSLAVVGASGSGVSPAWGLVGLLDRLVDLALGVARRGVAEARVVGQLRLGLLLALGLALARLGQRPVRLVGWLAQLGSGVVGGLPPIAAASAAAAASSAASSIDSGGSPCGSGAGTGVAVLATGPGAS